MTADNDTNGTAEKVGVYICHCGGNISDHVDVDRLARNVAQVPGVTVTHTNMFMCSDPGQEHIQEDIKAGKINRVVVASCAPSLHEPTFRAAIKRSGMNPYLYEHANIREQVSWVHHGDAATQKATGLVSAAIAKSKALHPLEPVRVEARQHATVIGGGIAGMRAALDLARRGIRVALVEKSHCLGGRTAALDRLYPTEAAAKDLVAALASEVLSNDTISVYGRTEICGYEGYVGNFRLRLRRAAGEDSQNTSPAGTWVPFEGVAIGTGGPATQTVLDTGAIILATGFQPYCPREGEFGYQHQPEVVTLPEFIRMTAEAPEGTGVLRLNGRPVRRLAFIHCVGSRQIPGIHAAGADGRVNEYCSRTCCSSILRAAVDIRSRYPRTSVLDYYRDIRTYGRHQEDYYERASRQNVIFFRYEADAPPVVEPGPRQAFPLHIRVKDTLTFGEEVSAAVDMVVLGVGMEAGPIPDLVDLMKLPTGQDRFLQEVHPKLRPVELANTGILLAGTCQAPMDIGESVSAAQASAVKATALLTRGYVELDPYVARVDAARCKGHGRCREVCPMQDAITLVDGKASVNPALCTGCGICVGECPESAIDVNGWTLQQYEDMVDAILAA